MHGQIWPVFLPPNEAGLDAFWTSGWAAPGSRQRAKFHHLQAPAQERQGVARACCPVIGGGQRWPLVQPVTVKGGAGPARPERPLLSVRFRRRSTVLRAL